jgi:hypothetical protein
VGEAAQSAVNGARERGHGLSAAMPRYVMSEV